MKKGVAVFLKYVKVEELVALALFFAVMAMNMSLYDSFSAKETLLAMIRYFSFGNEFLLFFGVGIFIASFYFFSRSLVTELVDSVFDKRKASPAVIKKSLRFLVRPLRTLFPVVIITIPFYSLLDNMGNSVSVFYDWLLYFADKAIIGDSIEIMRNAMDSDLFAIAFFKFYVSLPVLMGLSLIIVYFKDAKVFRFFILAYIITLPLAFFIYPRVPTIDPSNYFLYSGNSYENGILSHFQEGSEARRYSDRIHISETSDSESSPPISVFPSMHAAWAVLAVIFLGKIRPFTTFFTVPWVIIMLLGGLYYAQHYFVDYLAAIPIALTSMLIAYVLIGFETKLKRGEFEK